jgi:hypothetical protein
MGIYQDKFFPFVANNAICCWLILDHGCKKASAAHTLAPLIDPLVMSVYENCSALISSYL